MRKKSRRNSARNQKYPWYLSLLSVVLIICHGCVLVRLLAGLMAVFDLALESAAMQQKGLCFGSALAASTRGRMRETE